MRLPPSWRLVGRARARLYGRARARMYAGVAVCSGVGLACARVRGAVVAWGGRGMGAAGFIWECGAFAALRYCAATRIMEQFTRCCSNALDSRALHCLLPSAMLR